MGPNGATAVSAAQPHTEWPRADATQAPSRGTTHLHKQTGQRQWGRDRTKRKRDHTAVSSWPRHATTGTPSTNHWQCAPTMQRRRAAPFLSGLSYQCSGAGTRGYPAAHQVPFLAWNDCHHWKRADADTTGAKTTKVNVLSVAHSIEGRPGKRASPPPTAHSRVRRAGRRGWSGSRG